MSIDWKVTPEEKTETRSKTSKEQSMATEVTVRLMKSECWALWTKSKQ